MEKIDGLDENKELESEHYPVGIPINAGVCIKARRCEACGKVYFTNKPRIIKYRRCM